MSCIVSKNGWASRTQLFTKEKLADASYFVIVPKLLFSENTHTNTHMDMEGIKSIICAYIFVQYITWTLHFIDREGVNIALVLFSGYVTFAIITSTVHDALNLDIVNNNLYKII